MKTTVSLLILLTLFPINTFAANVPPRQKPTLNLDAQLPIVSIAFSPNSQSVASGGWAEATKLWDLTSEQPNSVTIGAEDETRSVAFSPDGSTLATGGDDKTVRLWDVASGATLKAIFTGHSDTVWSVAFSSRR